MKKTHYAVKVGRKCGVIVKSWTECSELVTGYSGAKFKGFGNHQDAIKWLGTVEKEKPIPKTQQCGTVFIPATTKKDKYGCYKPRYYAENGIRMAYYGRTIGASCDIDNLYSGSIPPWETQQ